MSSDSSAEPTEAVRGTEKKEAFHREAESRMKAFSFERPDVELKAQKGVYYLGYSDILRAVVQIIPEGGDNELHYHPGTDGFWMVLKGKARFYGPDGVIGEFGPEEGILMPRNCRYWFETADPQEELHLLQVAVKTQDKVQNSSVHIGERKPDLKPAMLLNFPPGVGLRG
jgi:mannose-6-phosphate isomerase-like protein (cupin superfamily)